MKHTLFCLFIAFSVGTKAQNLITNPGFENSLSTGWTIASGNWNQFNNGYGYGPPNAGTYYTSQGFGPNGTMYQDVDVSTYAVQIDNSTQSFTAAGYLQVGSNGTLAQITVDYRNSSGTVLLSNTMQETNSNFAVWNYKTVTATAPAGTRSIRFTLSTGGFDLAMFDDVSLIASGVLPLQFISFNGTAANNTVALNWQTENEINTKNFEIERSVDGINYQRVNTVNADKATIVTHSYSFTDNAPLQGVNYYRLKQTDKDGRFQYSSIAKVLFSSIKDLSVFYAPAANAINIQFIAKPLNIYAALYDINGHLIITKALINTNNIINTHTLSNGIYVVTVKSNNYTTASKIFIQH
jgi:hypothetical protein